MFRLTRSRTGTAAIALGALSALAVGTASTPADARQQAAGGTPKTVVDGLNGPRGVDALGGGRTIVSDSDGNIILVRERPGKPATKRTLTKTLPGFGAAVSQGRHGTTYILTGGGGPEGAPPPGGATLFKWRPGYKQPHKLADIAKYQATDPDPYNLDGPPGESNPFGVAAVGDGTVLVSDAAGNDLMRVWPNGTVRTVARLKPRTVTVPVGLPGAGTRVPSEDVATSVTIGADGYWYVGELRGYPATPGTSQIWRIKPGTRNAVCNPRHPYAGPCKRYVDGLTSVVDLGADRRGNIYAVTLSKKTWLAVENPQATDADKIGALYRVSPFDRTVRELAKDKLTLPGGVDVGPRGGIYLTGPVFGPGALTKLRP